MSRFKDRTGETRVMSCGIKATIIAYRGCEDIDVKFESGEIAERKSYFNFKNGHISPLIDYSAVRIGSSRLMTCGMSATVVAYRCANDIDVMFEDGMLKQHCIYSCFEKGNIKHPVAYDSRCRHERLGETFLMNCGLMATITAYKNSNDIDVQFEDNSAKKHVTYAEFSKKCLRPENLGKIDYHGLNIEKLNTFKKGNSSYCDVLLKTTGIVLLEVPSGSLSYIIKENKVLSFAERYKKCIKLVYVLNGVSYYITNYNDKYYVGTLEELREKFKRWDNQYKS